MNDNVPSTVSRSLSNYLNNTLVTMWHGCISQDTEFTVSNDGKDADLSCFEQGAKVEGSATGQSKVAFRATFGIPNLKMICNHRAILSLTIKSATLSLVPKNAGTATGRTPVKRSVQCSSVEC